MHLITENRSNHKIIGCLIQRKINKLLRIIPQEHMVGLEKIILVDEITDKREADIGGIYTKNNINHLGIIKLSMNVIFKGMPKILFFFPFIPDFSLADVLYHEIGHHYQKSLTHGIKKKSQEPFAEKYKKDMLKKSFWGWRFFLKPLAPFVRYLANRNQ